MSLLPRSTSRWTTRRFALDGSEWVTTAAAACVSTTAYLRHGRRYLAPGVAGDLIGFGVLSQVLRKRNTRLRHEAAVCLASIGAVTLATRRTGGAPVSEPVLWAAFAAGLAAYLQARRHTCQ